MTKRNRRDYTDEFKLEALLMITKEQVALEFGGARGLGEATALHLAVLGARVGIVDFDVEKTQADAVEIDGHSVQANVSDENSVGRAVADIEWKLGAPRMAVSCAVIGLATRIDGREGNPTFDVFQRTVNVNLMGTHHLMTHEAVRMKEPEPLADGERGVIVNISSVAYQDGQLGQSA